MEDLKKMREIVEEHKKRKVFDYIIVIIFLISFLFGGFSIFTGNYIGSEYENLKSANIAYIEKDFDKAIKHYKNVISLNENSSEAYHKLGLSYFKIGEYSLSIKNYNKALKVDKQNAKIYADLREAYYKNGYKTKALGSFNLALQLDPLCLSAKTKKMQYFGK